MKSQAAHRRFCVSALPRVPDDANKNLKRTGEEVLQVMREVMP